MKNIKVLINSNKSQQSLFNNAELSLNFGQVFFIIGLNGIGKSTLLWNLSQLKRSQDITFFIDQKKANRKDRKDLFKKTKYIFQNPKYQTFGQEVQKELSLSFDLKNEETIFKLNHLMDILNLEESFLNIKTWDLSFGQIRKFILLETLLSDKDILLMDEPGNNLDYKTQRDFFSILKKIAINENKIILIISHDLEIVKEYSDQTLTIYDGKIVCLNNVSDYFKYLNFNWLPIEDKVSSIINDDKINNFFIKEVNNEIN